MPQEPKPEVLLRYHLGELSPEERDEIEERYFLEDEFHDQVLAAEDELIDSYLLGRLTDEQQGHFETRFLQIGDRRQKVAFARTLIEAAQRKLELTSLFFQVNTSQKVLGPDHPDTATIHANYDAPLQNIGRQRLDELAQYHLGELSSEKRDTVEARYFADDGFHDQVLAAEEELIDSYLDGELSSEQREHFEAWFLQLHDRREKLIFARALCRFVHQRYPLELNQYRPAGDIEHLDDFSFSSFHLHRGLLGSAARAEKHIEAAREMRQKSLTGIKAIDITVASKPLGPYRTAQLVAEVEGRIKNSAVLSLTNDAPDATLCVDVDVQARGGSNIFGVRVYVSQPVTLGRTGDKAVAITWGPVSSLGMDSTIEEAFDSISKNVGDYIDLFLSDYLTANPKRIQDG